MKMTTTAWSLAESLSAEACERHTFLLMLGALTEAFRVYILLLSAVAYGQVVVQTELLVAIVTGSLALLGFFCAREEAGAGVLGGTGLGGAGFGAVGRGVIEVNNGAIGEASALAEGGRG